MTSPDSPAVSLVEALGAAWTAFGLYPDPERQPAFQRAMEQIKAVVGDGYGFQIGPGEFLVESDPVKTEREGVDRLARRCFVHRLEWLRLQPGISERDLTRFFKILDFEEAALSDAGGVEAALLRDGVDSISIAERVSLKATGETEIERDPAVAAVLEQGEDPEAFARSLVEEGAGDPLAVAELFEVGYMDGFGRVAEDDIDGREQVVKAFVEAFFFLPQDCQMAVFSAFLGKRDEELHRVLLDQFAGHELLKLAPGLNPDGLSMLLDYARFSTDKADRRPDELIALLEGPDSLQAAKEAVAGRIAERLRGGADDSQSVPAAAIATIKEQIPDSKRFFYDALDVFRGLLHAENRDPKFLRLLRIWNGKVSGAVRRGEYRRAELWVRALVDRPTYEGERSADVDQSMQQLAESETLTTVVAAATHAQASESAMAMIETLGGRAIGPLIDKLSETEDAALRRGLVAVLARLAATDPRPVLARMSDSRWYVVRNLVMVLGRSDSDEALPALRTAFEHSDHRVRVESLRGLMIANAPDADRFLKDGLSDPNESVRLSAVGFLSSRDSEESRVVLIDATGRGYETSVRMAAVKALGEYEDESSRATLQDLAGRFALFGSSRRLKDAAREALRGSR